jgi:hypothetical protein
MIFFGVFGFLMLSLLYIFYTDDQESKKRAERALVHKAALEKRRLAEEAEEAAIASKTALKAEKAAEAIKAAKAARDAEAAEALLKRNQDDLMITDIRIKGNGIDSITMAEMRMYLSSGKQQIKGKVTVSNLSSSGYYKAANLIDDRNSNYTQTYGGSGNWINIRLDEPIHISKINGLQPWFPSRELCNGKWDCQDNNIGVEVHLWNQYSYSQRKWTIAKRCYAADLMYSGRPYVKYHT